MNLKITALFNLLIHLISKLKATDLTGNSLLRLDPSGVLFSERGSLVLKRLLGARPPVNAAVQGAFILKYGLLF